MVSRDRSTGITLSTLAAMKGRGERIACLTCYDASFAPILVDAGVEVLLVGDSLGMVVQGHGSTLPVTLDHMVYHTTAVVRGAAGAFVMADLPFLTYVNVEQALRSAGRLMQEAGAKMVKLEGGERVLEVVHRLTLEGIPVCAHLGLLPQSVHRLGGYRYQGRDEAGAERICNEAERLQEAGAAMLVLECVPASLAAEITRRLTIPVIGIGAGAACDGQVLVLYDVLGLGRGPFPRFSRNFLSGQPGLAAAVAAYVEAVKSGTFPGPAEILF